MPTPLKSRKIRMIGLSVILFALLFFGGWLVPQYARAQSRAGASQVRVGAPIALLPLADAPTIFTSATTADQAPYSAGTWTNQAVTVHFMCASADPGIASCPADQEITVEGTTVVSGTVIDNAGNTATASFGPILIDTTLPEITVSATTADHAPYTAGTWTKQVVTVHFECDNTGSRIASCPADQVFSADGSFTATGTATDKARNSADASFGPIQIDTTPPTVTARAITARGRSYIAGTWTNQPVTVRFSCDDNGGSDVASCPSNKVISAEGVITATGVATDNVGNSAEGSFGPVQIDTTPPTITASATTADGQPYIFGTWANQNVTVQYICHDGSSEVALCPEDEVFSTSGTATGRVVDNAGNSATNSFGPILITGSVTTPPCNSVGDDACADLGMLTDEYFHGLVGWGTYEEFTSDLTPSGDKSKRFQLLDGDNSLVLKIAQPNIPMTLVTEVEDGGCDDSFEIHVNGSGPLYTYHAKLSVGSPVVHRVSIPASLLWFTTVDVTFRNIATDDCGLAAVYNVQMTPDTTAPTITASATTADSKPYIAGTWANQPVTVRFTCDDADSGVVSCPDDQLFSNDGSSTALGTAIDNAGNSAEASFGPIQIDKKRPTITPIATTPVNHPYTAGTWTNQDVSVHFTCDDAESGVASCSYDQEIKVEGTSIITGTATDNAGNSADAPFGPIQIDRTPPRFTSIPISFTTQAASVDGTPIHYTTLVPTDTLDLTPIVSCDPPDGWTFPVGTTPVSCSVRDHAGNVGETVSFFVIINPATSATTLTSGGAAVYGQPISFTATLTSPAGLPTGSVTFKDGSATLGAGTLSGGVATFTTFTLSVGSHSISAVYAGEGAFAGSTSSSLNQTVAKAATTTSFTTSSNPSVAGQAVTFTATVAPVAPGAGAPSGTVTFKDGTATLGTATLSGGSATFTTSTLSVGNHSISVSYAGDANFIASVSASATQVVNSSSGFAVVVTSSANPSVYRQAVTFTASVAIAPTGKVTFMDGTRTLGTKNLVQGSASLTITNLSAGSHTITAVYNSYVSPPLTQVVNPADTSAALIAAPAVSVLGQSVTLTATIAILPPGAGTLTGTITFLDDATVLGTKNVSGGSATLTIKTLSVGSHTITATYNGTPNYRSSVTPALTQVVNPASTNTTLAVTSNPSVFGQKVTFTATVKAVAPGAGTPSGSIAFYDGTAILGSQPLTNGKATQATTTLAVGNHSITAMYDGSAGFASSTSAALSLVVNQANTTTTLTAKPNPANAGQTVTFTATVKAVAPGAGAPSGSVTFMDGTIVLGSAPLVSGKATLATTALERGSHTITAVYSGDTNFATSASAGLVQTIR